MGSYNDWKETLEKAINMGENIGISDKTINNIAEGVGEFLSTSIEPQNEEQRLLKDLWNAANSHDKHVLAKLVVKMTKNNDH